MIMLFIREMHYLLVYGFEGIRHAWRKWFILLLIVGTIVDSSISILYPTMFRITKILRYGLLRTNLQILGQFF